MGTVYVQLNSNQQVVVVFASPQDETVANHAELDDADPRYLAFISPPFDPAVAIQAILPARETILNRLTGIRQDAEDAQDTDLIDAIKVARQGIKDLPTAPGILTATDSDSFRTALIAAYGKIVESAPDALQKSFREISL